MQQAAEIHPVHILGDFALGSFQPGPVGSNQSTPSSLTPSKRGPVCLSCEPKHGDVQWHKGSMNQNVNTGFLFLALHFTLCTFHYPLVWSRSTFVSPRTHLNLMSVFLPDMNFPGLPFLLLAARIPAGREEERMLFQLGTSQESPTDPGLEHVPAYIGNIFPGRIWAQDCIAIPSSKS